MVASLSDDFARSDESLHASESSEMWSWGADAALAIDDESVKTTSSSYSALSVGIAESDLDDQDHRASIDVSGNNTSRPFGPIIRAADTSNFYFGLIDANGSISIRKRVSGADTTLGSDALDQSTTGTWALEAVGSTLTLVQNGTPRLVVEDDGTLLTGVRSGLMLGSVDSNIRINQFDATVLGAASTVADVTAKARDHQSVQIAWTADSEADHYEIRQGGVLIDETTDAFYLVTGLSGDAEYSFEVRGVNLVGNGTWSDAAAVTTPVFGLVRRETWWHFDAAPDDHGAYVNGDFWIIPPSGGINVTKIVVGDGLRESGDEAERDGSSKNITTEKHGFDGRGGGYDAATALYPPFAVAAGDKLISTWSSDGSSTYTRSHATGHEPYLLTLEILNVVAQAPAVDAFRPPYIGDDLGYTLSDMDLSKLPAFAAPSDVPDVTDVSLFDRPWYDLDVGANGTRYMHPDRNLASYGRELARESTGGAMALAFDVADRDDLAMHLCQIGLDLYAQAAAGREWEPDGGHWFGRKLPIVLAGAMLGDADMRTVGDEAAFQEDGQTFHIAQEDVDRNLQIEVTGNPQAVGAATITLSTSTPTDNQYVLNDLHIEITDGPGVGQRRPVDSYDRDTRVATLSEPWTVGDEPTTASTYRVIGYETEDLGVAEFGIRHSTNPKRDNPSESASYRTLTAGVYKNMALTVLLHNLEGPWAHLPLFDYVERHHSEIDTDFTSTWGMGGEAWGLYWADLYAAIDETVTDVLVPGSISQDGTTLTATDASGGLSPYTYQWHYSEIEGFTPTTSTQLTGETALTLDLGDLAPDLGTYYFVLAYTDSEGLTVLSNELAVVIAEGDLDPLLIRKLEAVNEMLEAIGEPHVKALDTGGNSVVGEAELVLDREHSRILERGWHANTDLERTYSPNALGEIPLPDVLKIRAVYPASGAMRRPRVTDPLMHIVIRNGKLYDLDSQSFKFDKDITLEVVELIDLGKLHGALATYVVKAAAFRFQRWKKRGRIDDQMLGQELAMAKMRADQEDADMNAFNVLQTREARRLRGQRNRLDTGL